MRRSAPAAAQTTAELPTASSRRSRRPRLALSLQFGAFADIKVHRAALARHMVARCIRHALEKDGQIAVRIVGLDEGRALNRDYRRKDYATNVLTFHYSTAPVHADLVLCAPVVANEALALNKPLQEHYAHLLVHGTLHAQGYDHETGEAAAKAMEALETKIMLGLSWGDPYLR